MPEQPVDTLDYLTDEQLRAQLGETVERSRELVLAFTRNDDRRSRLAGAITARGLR